MASQSLIALRETHAALVTMIELLRQERAAIAKLDAPKIKELAELKMSTAIELRDRMSNIEGTDAISTGVEAAEQRALRRAIRSASITMRANAEANAALLTDAVEAMGEILGIAPDPGTYDARARRTQRITAIHDRLI